MPRVRLTEQMIQAARKPGELWDTDVPGLFLRVQPRKKTWGIRYFFAAKDEDRSSPRRRDLLGVYPGLGLYDAREKARKVLRELEAGADPRLPARQEPHRLLGELAELFARDYLPKETRPSTQREWGRLIRVELQPLLGDVDPAYVREARWRVREALDKIVARGAGETANRLRVVASRVLSWAVSRDLVDPAASGVFVGLEMPVPTQARSRVLTDDEIRRLWPAIQDEPPREAAFWELAFRTGQRKGEILAATFEQFAAPHEWRFIVKGGREHWLGLPRHVDDILARLRVLAGKSPYIFASREAESGHLATLQKSLGRLKSATGIDFRIHDIRRTVATKLGSLGITDDVVSRVLSHSAGGGGAAITRRHYNLAQQVAPTRKALQTLSDHLDSIISEKPTHQPARSGRSKTATASDARSLEAIE
ncbi:MAG TPA: tyrosine-type recombinase/integrase [Thermoanaerobaculia bacterium]|jgi:integrase|nr:tyrosine-type recombinase/integrase [Thermoanaerobaculia bacterium]